MPSYVYEIRNRVTGEIYVGQSNNIEARWESHVGCVTHPLYVAMHEHGLDAFEMEIIDRYPTTEQAKSAEAAYIRGYIEQGARLYNRQGNKGAGRRGPESVSTTSRCECRCDGVVVEYLIGGTN